MKKSNSVRNQEALDKAVNGLSVRNYPAIFKGFEEKGIPTEDIKPRENVFTFGAWKAKGRYVMKGQKGVKVVTVIRNSKKETNDAGEEVEVGFNRPWSTTVFHVSQTAEMEDRKPKPFTGKIITREEQGLA